MKYLGSKRRLAKHLLPIMLSEAEAWGLTTWVEPFVGGGNMIDQVPNRYRRIGIDYNAHTIAALIAIRDMAHQIPDSLTEQEYKKLKGSEPDPIKSLLRFTTSFGSKFDGGYARRKGSNALTFAGRGKRNALKQSPLLKEVELITGSYELCTDYTDCIIYCDPPYQGATGYNTGAFDHVKFWDWCRLMSRTNLVFVSEYNAPSDFKCLWSGEVSANIHSARLSSDARVEKLFSK